MDGADVVARQLGGISNWRQNLLLKSVRGDITSRLVISAIVDNEMF